MECKHGNNEPCDLCEAEDAEHDREMDIQARIEDSADKSPLASNAKTWALKQNGLWEPTGGTDTKMPFDDAGFSIVNCDFQVEGGAWKRVWVDKRVIDEYGGIPVGTVGWE
jgi:hypothetical protein